MRSVSVVLILVLVALASAAPASDRPQYDLNDAPALFEKFIKDYDRHYKDDADREVHYQAFRKSLEQINKLNKESTSATFDINNLADFTPEESKNLYGLRTD